MANYTIDATNKKLGRVATEAANMLRGKNEATYAPNKLSGNRVTIENAGKIDLSGVKLAEMYDRYSGYPGGRKEETRGHLIERRGIVPVFQHAVRGMLPKNRLRDRMMKNLIINE